MRVPTMVTVFQDRDALSRGAAELFAETARRAVRDHGRFLVLLSGGETPRASYQLLARDPLRGSIPWQAVQLFWGDERWVPPDDPLSNAKMVRDALLDQVPLDQSQVHPVPYEPTARESALKYERMLRSFFDAAPPQFDLVLLGLGTDGHTASLFPGGAPLDEPTRWVCEVNPKEKDIFRVTTTPHILNQAALVVFLAAGREKAGMLRRVLEDKGDPKKIPARLIHPDKGRILWLVDREASLELPESVLTS